MNTPLEKLTIVVHSCDSYSDLWVPFFTLLKKYWPNLTCPIILNTESKDFSFSGLNITCVHPKNINVSYSARLKNALKYVKTEYVLPLLDDFFLRETVDEKRIEQIITYMEQDKSITYFNSESTPLYCNDFEADKYEGFHRIPPGNNYTLNMQAAIWRTERYCHYWKGNVSPWEWEFFVNVKTCFSKNEKFYCALSDGFLDYGHKATGDIWGVYRGKWVIEDVKPLFLKENISVNFCERGIFDLEKDSKKAVTVNSKFDYYSQVIRTLGFFKFFPGYFLTKHKRGAETYYAYLQNKAKEKFLTNRREHQND